MKESIDWQTYDGSSLYYAGFDSEDIQTMRDLFSEAFTNGSGITPSRFLQRAADHTVLLGSDAGEITALSTYSYQPYTSESFMMVDTLAIDERYRRQGLGSVALGRIIDEAIELGCDHVRLHARKSVLPFYTAHGFELNKHIRTDHSYVPMHLKLSQVALSEETTLRSLVKPV